MPGVVESREPMAGLLPVRADNTRITFMFTRPARASQGARRVCKKVPTGHWQHEHWGGSLHYMSMG